ncbi:chemotaxis protein CheX [Reinekea blandensis]|nr:chemotaxis protein CheX [Reinekea blandensis]
MDVRIINPFLEATLDVARTMAQLEVTVGKPVLKQGHDAPGQVSGFIHLNGLNHKGSLAISFSSKALLLIYRNMLGEPLETLDDSALDLAGEITNMVCGGAKQRLASKGYEFDLTQPTLLSGSPHSIEHTPAGPVVTLPLHLPEGEMYLEVCLNR